MATIAAEFPAITGPPIATWLDAHQQRRQQGLPTLSLLVGAPASVFPLWTDWNRAARRPSATWVPTRDASVLDPWLSLLLSQLLSRPDGVATMRDGLSAAQPPAPVAAALDWLQQRLWQAHLQERPLDATQIPAVVRTFHGHLSAQAPGQDPGQAPWDEARALAGLLAAIPHQSAPALLIAVALDATSDSNAATLEQAARIAEQAPRLTLAVTLSAEQLHGYLASSAESRTKAMVRAGRLALPRLDEATLRRWLHAQQACETPTHCPLADTLSRHGVSKQVLQHLPPLLHTLHQRDSREASDQARSQAERLLFAWLESTPDLAGVFRLNVPLAIQFGSRPLEVDLLADPPGVAVELDGYFHFQDASRYRRDRHKDWLLQQQGLLVLRFLAEDVVSDLEGLLATLRAALHHRQSVLHPPTPRPPTGHYRDHHDF